MRLAGSRTRALAAILLCAVTLFLGGCVYLRLLEVKHQLADFDRNFAVETSDGFRIICRHPVLRSDDIRWIGLEPETAQKLGHAEQWQVRWVKQLPPGVHEAGAFDIVINLMFGDDKLTRIAIPERYFALMPKSLLLDLLRSLGGAKINRDSRSIEAQLAVARPDLPGIQKLLGRPTASLVNGEDTMYEYRYIPVAAGGVATRAVFDMKVHFNSTSGELLRWEGTTPVGKIGFNFSDKR